MKSNLNVDVLSCSLLLAKNFAAESSPNARSCCESVPARVRQPSADHSSHRHFRQIDRTSGGWKTARVHSRTDCGTTTMSKPYKDGSKTHTHTHRVLMMLEGNRIVEQSSFCVLPRRTRGKHHPKDEKDGQSETTPTSVPCWKICPMDGGCFFILHLTVINYEYSSLMYFGSYILQQGKISSICFFSHSSALQLRVQGSRQVQLLALHGFPAVAISDRAREETTLSKKLSFVSLEAFPPPFYCLQFGRWQLQLTREEAGIGIWNREQNSVRSLSLSLRLCACERTIALRLSCNFARVSLAAFGGWGSMDCS